MVNASISRIRFAAAVACCFIATSALAEGLGGSFAGEVTQNEPPQTFPMEMNLYGSIGNISYPTLRCAGNLVFLRSDGTAYWYRETITHGREACIDGGTIEIRPHALGGSTNWEWRWSKDDIVVRGVVRGAGAPHRP